MTKALRMQGLKISFDGKCSYMNDFIAYFLGASLLCVMLGGFIDKKLIDYGFIGIGVSMLLGFIFYIPMGLFIVLLFLFMCELLRRNSK